MRRGVSVEKSRTNNPPSHSAVRTPCKNLCKNHSAIIFVARRRACVYTPSHRTDERTSMGA
jgi:hypothetical protein